jgi:hypothetical protein
MSLVTLLLAALPAAAQDAEPYGFDAHGFRFVSAVSDPRAPLRFYRPAETPALGWSAGAMAEYATRPLLFEADDGTRFVASSNLAAVNVAAGFTPIRGLSLDVSAPVILTNTWGAAPYPARDYVTESAGPTLGDLRVSVLGAPLVPSGGGAGLGFVAALDLPTGAPERWLGTRGPAALLAAAGTFELDALTASAQAGARLAPNTAPDARPAPTIGGDTVELAGSVGWLLDDGLGLALEATASVPIDAQVRAALSVPAEATLVGRYRADSGAHVAAGLGVGLGAGAGASPVRLVVGGGFGSAVSTTPKDSDGDGFADRDETCPLEAETPNQFLDDDGCPDVLPRSVVSVTLDGAPVAEATLTVTTPDGVVRTSTGTATIDGLPSRKYQVTAALGACRTGEADVTLPMEGSTTSSIALSRAESSVLLSVFDATGRPLEGAQVRYVIEEEACRPTDVSLRAGRGSHVMGVGPVKLFVTAMGYDVYQTSFTLVEGEQTLVEAKLKPTSVSLKDGRVKVMPALQFAAGTATLDARSLTTMQQVASVLLSQETPVKVEIAAWADGRDAKKLSLDRATAVKDQLLSFGVSPELLIVAGKGALPKDQKDVVVMTVVP